MDFDRFSEPIDEASPCGPDCEYDNDFLALSQAVVGKPEQQFGDTVIAAVEPDWRQVDALARALLGRTRDLRVVCWLALANTHLQGVSAFASGLKLMVTLCERYWDAVHPRIEVDGDIDPYLRMNAILAFSGSEFSGEGRLIQALRSSALTKTPVPLTYRQVEIGLSNATESAYSQSQIESILTDAIAAGNTDVLQVVEAWQGYQLLRALLDEKITSGETPDLDRLASVLKPVAHGIDRMRAATAVAGDGGDAAEVTLRDPGGSGDVVSAHGGQVKNREDARRALERVCDYLERHEPSNPASLFARRAQRMLNMNFLDIMRELSPESMHQLETLTGAKTPQE